MPACGGLVYNLGPIDVCLDSDNDEVTIHTALSSVTRFVVVQKPMQNIIAVVLFATAILVLAGVMTVSAQEKSGIVLPGMILTRVATDSVNSLLKRMPVHETGSYHDCEVIYHRTSLRSEYAIIASETGEEAMPALYHAVYTCTCPAVIALVSA